jgi:hypothetical protein
MGLKIQTCPTQAEEGHTGFTKFYAHVRIIRAYYNDWVGLYNILLHVLSPLNPLNLLCFCIGINTGL